MEKNLDYYMSLDYPYTFRADGTDKAKTFMASIKHLRIFAVSDSIIHAYTALKQLKYEVLKDMLDRGLKILEPTDQIYDYVPYNTEEKDVKPNIDNYCIPAYTLDAVINRLKNGEVEVLYFDIELGEKTAKPDKEKELKDLMSVDMDSISKQIDELDKQNGRKCIVSTRMQDGSIKCYTLGADNKLVEVELDRDGASVDMSKGFGIDVFEDFSSNELFKSLDNYVIHLPSNTPSSLKLYEKIRFYKKIAVALWGLLDDISTAGDQAKDNDKLFRKLVDSIQIKQYKYAESPDGFCLRFKSEEEQKEFDTPKKEEPIRAHIQLPDSSMVVLLDKEMLEKLKARDVHFLNSLTNVANDRQEVLLEALPINSQEELDASMNTIKVPYMISKCIIPEELVEDGKMIKDLNNSMADIAKVESDKIDNKMKTEMKCYDQEGNLLFETESNIQTVSTGMSLAPTKNIYSKNLEMTKEEREKKLREFKYGVEKLINGLSLDNMSDTPDFILAEYLMRCLENFNASTRRRTKWYSK